jgi:hypothetical protein
MTLQHGDENAGEHSQKRRLDGRTGIARTASSGAAKSAP